MFADANGKNKIYIEMARILTGIQSSGRPHLGNILGAIVPAMQLMQEPGNECLYFIADMHSLTTVKDPVVRRQHVHAVAAAWLAFGFDTEKHLLYRQSDMPEVAELAWYLNCFTPYPMLANAHSFKDKSDRLADVNAGLFAYPVLMAADILLYDAQFVPVGKDQLQHLEITRDITGAFNRTVGHDLLVMPEARMQNNVMTVPGTDGQKMSKSYHNTIDIFVDDKQLLKTIKTIVTDSTPLEEPKNPDSDVVFKLYAMMADQAQTEDLRGRYLAGGFGYGHAKQALYDLIISKFAVQREKFNHYMQQPQEIEAILAQGAARARVTGQKTLANVRQALGFGPVLA